MQIITSSFSYVGLKLSVKHLKNILRSFYIVVNAAGDFGDTCNNLRVLCCRTGMMVCRRISLTSRHCSLA